MISQFIAGIDIEMKGQRRHHLALHDSHLVLAEPVGFAHFALGQRSGIGLRLHTVGKRYSLKVTGGASERIWNHMALRAHGLGAAVRGGGVVFAP